jgi:hypothetical protein
MKMTRPVFAALPCLLALHAFAQPQIGGGTCASSTLNGVYSLTLTGRDLTSSVAFSNAEQGIGSANFDGLSKVTLTLTNNSNKGLGLGQTLSGTYSLQANCVGALNITSGDTASFTLISYNQGESYLIAGQDGVYSLMGSGSLLPASCAATTLSGVYAFNGTGFSLNSNAIAGVNYISGLITFAGTSAVTTTWYLSANGSTTTVSTTGTYALGTGCTATAKVADASGNSYSLVLTITAANGGNFIFSGANSAVIFSGAGRTL